MKDNVILHKAGGIPEKPEELCDDPTQEQFSLYLKDRCDYEMYLALKCDKGLLGGKVV